MQFDNESFEKNVHVTINSVKELKDSLRFDSEATSSLSNALNRIDLSHITSGLDNLQNRFSTFGIVGFTAIQRITNAVIDLGLTMERKLTGVLTAGWNQIVTGGTSRAANIEQATFQLQGLFGKEIEGQNQLKMAMTGTTEEIKNLTGMTEDMIVAESAANYAVADTAYGLDSAAKAASQLAASGVDVIAYNEELADSAGHMRTEMQVALRAISGTAAMTNSDYDSMAHIFATVAGNGRLMSEQLNSLGARGLNAAATLSNYFRETGLDANATEASIREMVSKGKIDFMTFAKAMDSAYGEHAKDANSTFTGALSNMKFALSKIGADFIAPLRDDLIPVLNNVRMAFNAVRASLTPFLTAFKNSSAYITDKMLEKFKTLIGFGETDAEWKASDQWNNAIKNITDVVQTATDILFNFGTFVESIVKPIGEAWKEMFPSKGYSGFFSMLNRLKEFTYDLILSADAMEKVKRTAKGIFSIVNIAKQIVTPIIDGIKELLRYLGILDTDVLGFTSDIGDAVYELSESGKIGDSVKKVVDKVVGFIERIIDAIKSTDSLNISGFSFNLSSILDSIKGFFSGLSTAESSGSGAKKALGIFLSIAEAIGDILSNVAGNFVSNPEQAGENIVSIGEVAIMTVGLIKILQSIKGVNSVNPELFKQIIISIAAIALSLILLASIDRSQLQAAVIAIVAIFAVLALAIRAIARGFSYFNQHLLELEEKGRTEGKLFDRLKSYFAVGVQAKITTMFDSIGVFAKQLGTSLMIGSVAAAVFLLVKGVTNIAGLFGELTDKFGQSDAIGIVIASIIVIAGGLFAVMKVYDRMVKYTEKVDDKSQIKVAVAITSLSNFVKTLANAAVTFAKFQTVGEWLSALTGIVAIILSILAVFKIMEKSSLADMNGNAKMLIAIAITFGVLMKSINSMAKTASESTTGMKSVLVAAGVLAGIVVLIGALIFALNKVPANGTTLKTIGAIAAIVGVISLLGFTITQLAQYPWQQLLLSLIPIGAVMLALVGLGAVVGSVPGLSIGIFALAAGLAAIGIAAAGIGAGLYLGASAIGVLVDAIIRLGEAWRDNGPNIIAGMEEVLTKIVSLIPDIINKAISGFVDGIKENMDKITALAPYIATFIGTTLVGILNILANNVEGLVNGLVNLIVNVINALATRTPEIIEAFKNVIGPWLDSIVGLIATIIGSLAEGIGEIFGRAISGLINGVARSLDEEALVNFADSLAEFMFHLKPFIDGLKGLDESSMRAALMLAAVISIITADNIINSATKWLTGGNSLEEFGKQLAAFGPYIKQYSEDVAGIDVAAVEASANAATMIAEFAGKIPNEGGLLGKIVGENDIAVFGQKLKEFGPYLKQYSEDVAGIDAAAVTSSTLCAMMISDFANTIPNTGGLVAKITGDNDIGEFGQKLKSFGKYISKYAEEVKDIDAESIESSVSAALMLTEFANAIPNTGGLKAIFEGDNSVDKFGEQLTKFGKFMAEYYDSISSIDADKLYQTSDALTNLFKVLGLSDKVSKDSVNNLADILERVAEVGIDGFLNIIAEDSDTDISDAIGEFFKKVDKEFEDSSKLFGIAAEVYGRAIIASYIRGMTDKTEDVRTAADTIGKQSVRALGDAIGDPVEEPATETIPVGHSYDLGYIQGLIDYQPDINSLAFDVGYQSVDNIILGASGSEDAGLDIITQYANGLLGGESVANANAQNIAQSTVNSVESVAIPGMAQAGTNAGNAFNAALSSSVSRALNDKGIDSVKPSLYRPVYSTLVDQQNKDRNKNKNTDWSSVMAMRNYNRVSEQADYTAEQLANTYAQQAAAARNASRATDSLSKSTSGASGSASKAKTEFEKLAESIDDLMERYEKRFETAKERANKDLFKGVDDQGDDFLDKIKDIMNQYEDIYASAVQRTNNQDLFAEINENDESFAPETLLNNLEDQVNQINELNTIISSLGGRIADQNLNAAISAMDVDDLPQLRALYRMSPTQLAEYERMYKKKVEANSNKIQNELTGSLSQLTGEYTNVATYVATDASTNRLVNNLEAQINKLNDYNTTVASLMGRIKDVHLREAIAQMGIESLDELKTLNSMTDTELDNYAALYNTKLIAEMRSVSNELSGELGSLLGAPVDIDAYYQQWVAGQTQIQKQLAEDKAVEEAAKKTGNAIGAATAEGAKESFTTDDGYAAGKDYTDAVAKGMKDNDAMANLSSSVHLIINTLTEYMIAAYDDFLAVGHNIAQHIIDGIREKTDGNEDFINSITEINDVIIENLQKSIEDYKSFATDIAEQIVSKMEEEFTNKESRFESIGRQIVAGIRNGIINNQQQLVSTTSSLANRIVNTMKQALKIKSPSRVFMEIGRFVDEGFANGLKQYSGLATDEAGSMAEGSIATVQNAISKLSGMLDGSIDVNPVITPTLDLSEVNARSQALSNMFNGRQIAVQAQADLQQAEMISKLGDVLAQQNSEPRTITFNQTNNSPKALSPAEVYRNSKNAFSRLASAIT